jgi:hypothetical protein
METQGERNPKPDSAEAVEHIASAQQILNALQEKIGRHPELAAAINKLEVALNILTIKTGALL